MDPVKTLVRDVVCNMNVDPSTARATAEYEGKKYYFCCAGCAAKFNADPKKYLTSAAPLPDSGSHQHMAGSHQQKPGTVKDPACGMWVDPEKARGTADYKSKTYYFCSRGCKLDFDEDPAGVLKAEAEYDHSQPMDHGMMSEAQPTPAEKRPWWQFWRT